MHGMEIVKFVTLSYVYLLAVLHFIGSLFCVQFTTITSLTYKISINVPTLCDGDEEVCFLGARN
jgi:hypothetical protein